MSNITETAPKEGYGGNMNGNQYGSDLAPTRTIPTHQAFGGALAPGPYSEQKFRKFANVAPLGLSAFALTTFILSLINMHARHVTIPAIVIGPALAYGGLVQLLAGMWEVAVGNTFGAVALSSYGGFWLSYAAIVINSPGQSFGIIDSYVSADAGGQLDDALGFFLIAWFIFTTLLMFCTLKSTVAFFSLFFMLDITFLLLAIGAFEKNEKANKAGGVFGIITAFIAWYNAYAGIADKDNSFFQVPVVHFPWSEKVLAERRSGNTAV